MNWDMPGRRVLVTGGTRGLGRAMVEAFVGTGADVLTCHRGNTPVDGLDGVAHVVRVDVGDRDGASRLAAAVAATLGGLDLLVNNVGAYGSTPLEQLTEDEWARVIDGNVTTTYRVTRAMLPLLASGSSMINIGGASALRGQPDAAHHTAAKAALIGLTRALGKELGARGVRVNTIAPGMIDDGGVDSPVARQVAAVTPLGRLCTPADVAGVALFLASPAAAFVTGATIYVDGGI